MMTNKLAFLAAVVALATGCAGSFEDDQVESVSVTTHATTQTLSDESRNIEFELIKFDMQKLSEMSTPPPPPPPPTPPR